MPRHSSAVQKLQVVPPQVLCSAGLDGHVMLWDLTKLHYNYCGQLRGHTRGVGLKGASAASSVCCHSSCTNAPPPVFSCSTRKRYQRPAIR